MKRAVAISVGLIALAGVTWFLLTRDQLDGGDSLKPTTITSLIVRESFKVPLASFRADVGRFPTTEEGLAALFHCPTSCEKSWKGPYLEPQNGGLPKDPWGSTFQYSSPGTHNPESFDLWSLGPDRVQSDDDIGNWKR